MNASLEHGHRHPEHHGEVTVVVSGTPAEVSIIGQEHVSTLVRTALAQTGNVGQKSEEWELRSQTGEVIGQHETIHHAGIRAGQTLFLSPHAGVGGNR